MTRSLLRWSLPRVRVDSVPSTNGTPRPFTASRLQVAHRPTFGTTTIETFHIHCGRGMKFLNGKHLQSCIDHERTGINTMPARCPWGYRVAPTAGLMKAGVCGLRSPA